MLNTVLILERELSTMQSYNKIFDKCYQELVNGIELAEVRHKPIYFKFYENDDKIHELTMTRFMINIILISAYTRLGGPPSDVHLDESFILDFENLSNNQIKNFIDKKIIQKYKNIDDEMLNNAIAEVREALTFCKNFTMILASGICIKDDIDLANRNDHFKDLINTVMPENLQPNEREIIQNRKLKELISLLKSEPTHYLSGILKCKEGIKEKHLGQYMICGGNMPDLNGRILQTTINTNYYTRGLSSVTDAYTDSCGGRKAAIMNDVNMGPSGHFARKLSLLNTNTLLDDDCEYDCGSSNFVKLNIDDKKYLSLLRGRYYRDPNTNKDILLTEESTNIIGKTILLRSPVTCAGEHVCYKCYGDVAYRNNRLHIGQIAATTISEPLTQGILSVKHLLATNSKLVKFNKEFHSYFKFDGSMMFINDELTEDRIAKLVIKIDKSEIKKDEEYDDSDYNEKLDSSRFVLIDKKNNVEYDIYDECNNEMYLTPAFKHLLIKKGKRKNGFIYLDLKNLMLDSLDLECEQLMDETVPMFYVVVENNELTKPLKDLTRLIDRKDRLGCVSIDAMLNKSIELFIAGNIKKQLLHIECIIRNLIRDTEDVLRRPDFSQADVSYQILTLSAALLKNPSIAITFAYQDIRRQLENPLTFLKTEKSLIDIFYSENPEI